MTTIANEIRNAALHSQITEALKRHDFSFEYSDDPGVWRQGVAERNAIARLIALARAEGMRLDEYRQYITQRAITPHQVTVYMAEGDAWQKNEGD